MNPITLPLLASTFKLASWLLGLPSLAVLLLWAWQAATQPSRQPVPATNFGDNPDALMLMLQGLATGLETLGRGAALLGEWLLNLLAAGAGVGLVLALACGLIGRGLQAQAAWARGSAFVLLTGALLLALLLALSFDPLGRVLMLLLAMGSALALHGLWVGPLRAAP